MEQRASSTNGARTGHPHAKKKKNGSKHRPYTFHKN